MYGLAAVSRAAGRDACGRRTRSHRSVCSSAAWATSDDVVRDLPGLMACARRGMGQRARPTGDTVNLLHARRAIRCTVDSAMRAIGWHGRRRAASAGTSSGRGPGRVHDARRRRRLGQRTPVTGPDAGASGRRDRRTSERRNLRTCGGYRRRTPWIVARHRGGDDEGRAAQAEGAGRVVACLAVAHVQVGVLRQRVRVAMPSVVAFGSVPAATSAFCWIICAAVRRRPASRRHRRCRPCAWRQRRRPGQRRSSRHAHGRCRSGRRRPGRHRRSLLPALFLMSCR